MKNAVIAVGVLMITLNTTAGAEKSTNNSIKTKHEHPKPEEVMAKLDANKDNKISKEEAKGPLKVDFTTVDKNADGFITLEELNLAPKPEHNLDERPKPEDLVSKLDSNKDSKISKEEAKGPLNEDFTMLDKNNDGFITLVELKNAPKPEHNPGERPKPEDIMTKLDANNDSKISKEEAKGPLGEEFQKVDADKDGYITFEELKNVPKPIKKK